MNPFTVIHVSAVIIAAWAFTQLMKGSSAARRHLVWLCALCCVLIIPIADRFLPTELNILPPPPPAKVIVDESFEQPMPTAMSADCCSIAPARTPPKPPLDWQPLFSLIWLAGSGILVLRLLMAIASITYLSLRSRNIQHKVFRATTAVPKVPLALASKVILPRESSGWTSERTNLVLKHELAHLRRHDFAWNLLAECACALFWFNPLVWLGARAMRAEAESAADDLVLADGVRASDYAEELLQMSAELAHVRRGFALPGVPSMLTSKLEARLTRILSAHHSRRGITTMTVLITLVCAAFLAPLVAGIHLGGGTQKRSGLDAANARAKLKSIALATIMYAADYDDRMPTAKSTDHVKSALQPYLKEGQRAFDNPTPGAKFIYNNGLSGRVMTSFMSPTEVPTWFEAMPNPSDPANLSFLDGHVILTSGDARQASKSLSHEYKFRMAGTKGTASESWVILLDGSVFLKKPFRTYDQHARKTDLVDVIGKGPSAPVAAVSAALYTDYDCAACKRQDAGIRSAALRKGYFLTVKQFPMPNHPLARYAAEIVETAREQGKFESVYSLLIQTSPLTKKALDKILSSVGGSVTRSAKTRVQADIDSAMKLKLTSVPSIVVQDSGSVKVMRAAEFTK